MVDKIFSFAELGFQEIESSKYLTGVLQENGFEIIYSEIIAIPNKTDSQDWTVILKKIIFLIKIY